MDASKQIELVAQASSFETIGEDILEISFEYEALS
jgi:hypothetical protein